MLLGEYKVETIVLTITYATTDFPPFFKIELELFNFQFFHLSFCGEILEETDITVEAPSG